MGNKDLIENKDLIIKINGEITKYKCYKKVVVSGGSGAITLPKQLVGKEVYVEKDISDEGKYGRKLRYVYLDDLMINKYLVENGFAKVYDKYKDDTKRYDELKAVENQNIGAWVCKDPKEGCLYVGSKNSDKYHKIDCTYAKKIKPENLVCYHSDEEVKDLNKCKTCFK